MNKFLTKIATAFVGMAMAVGVGVAVGASNGVREARAASDESVDFSAQGYSNGAAISSYSGTNFSVAFDKGTNSNAPKYYNSGTAIRCYGGNTFTVSSTSKTFAEISLTFGSSDGSNDITTNVPSYSSGTWSTTATDVNSVKFTIGGTAGNRRLAGIAVTYGDATSSPLKSISLNTENVTKKFAKGSTFNYEGLVVTANYEDNSSKAVTSFTVVAPDMTTAGKKDVEVSYTEGEVTKTATYEIEVVELSTLTLTGSMTKTEYYVGESWNYEGVVVTATYSDESSETIPVNTTGLTWTANPTAPAYGTTSVSFTATYGEVTSEPMVKEGLSVDYAPGSEQKPYTVAEARAAIDAAGSTPIENAYVKGIIFEVSEFNSKFSSLTYWISDDGTDTDGLEVYSGKNIDNTDFTGLDDLRPSDIVVVKGQLKKYNDVYEFNYNNILVSLERVPQLTSINIEHDDITLEHSSDGTVAELCTLLGITLTAEEGYTKTTADLTWESNNEDAVAFIDDEYMVGNAGEEATLTASLDGKSATAKVTVIDSSIKYFNITLQEGTEHLAIKGTSSNIQQGETAEVTIEADAYWLVPNEISVTNGGEEGNWEYTVENGVGTLTVLEIAGDMVVTAVAQPASITKIEVTEQTTSFKVGVSFTFNGKVTATYNDKAQSTLLLTSDKYTVNSDAFDSSKAGEYDIVVTLVADTSITCKVSVTVSEIHGALPSGRYFIYTDNGALENRDYPNGTSTKVDKSETSAWVFTLVDEDTYTISNGTNYIYPSKANTGLRTREAACNWTLEDEGDGYYSLSASDGSDTRWLCDYVSSVANDWRTYKSSAIGTMYKLRIVEEKQVFAENFLDTFTKGCNADGGYESKDMAWSDAKTQFDTLSEENRLVFKQAEAYARTYELPENPTAENYIGAALARYDYIVGKYGKTVFEDFMLREPAPVAQGSYIPTMPNATNSNAAIVVVIIASLLGVTAFGVFFLLRKGKQR